MFTPLQAAQYDPWETGRPDIPFCQGDDCGFWEGVDAVKDGINDIEKERKFSEYIQDVIGYVLTFVSLLAVAYIMYAGFQILTWNGDEEKLKKSRQTIIYVIIGIIVIWLAWSITSFIINILNAS